MTKFLTILSIISILTSCQKFTKLIDSNYSDRINIKNGSDHVKLLFSHNINGETHPCGCRKFPLGGLPQVAGYMSKAKKESSIIYVDTGDMLFQTTNIPPYYEESMQYTAEKLAEIQHKLNLRVLVPGELDLSLGEGFLKKVTEKNELPLLIANLSESSKLNAKAWIKYELGKRTLYLIGIVNPNVFTSPNQNIFTDPKKALEESLKEIESDKSKNKTIILLSHGGMEFDRRIAKTFNQINWIIGSHSQAFLRYPEVENKTKIVQVLSRNHYLGLLKIPLNPEKEIKYEQIEVRDELEKEIKNNPISKWLESYKTELDKIQAKEQNKFGNSVSYEETKARTYISCSSCHSDQVDFWNTTAHSLAYQTLIQAKAANNPSCIKCHSVHFNQPNGFAAKSDIIQGEELSDEKMEKYWQELSNNFKDTGSIRDLKPKKRKELAEKWHKLDNTFKVEHNFANVQCLNCHDQNNEHPFEESEKSKVNDYTAKCIVCHTSDQSPSWYEENKQGLATKLKKKYVEQKIKEVACPKMN